MLAGKEVEAKSKQVSDLRKRPEERSRIAQHQSQVEAVTEETPMAAIQSFDSEDVIRHRDMGCKHLRKTGIEFLGDCPWGTHFCQFYQTKEDLIEILVPYFKAGLENNEFCMWITSEPLGAEDAERALKKKAKDLDNYIKKGQIEILDFSQWYTRSGRFDSDQVLRGWVEKEQKALEKGFDGLRLTGNTFWLEKEDWKAFKNYEATVNSVIGNYRMLAICGYSLAKCTASEIIDVVSNHQFALVRRKGKLEIIESTEHKKMEEELQLKTHKLGEQVKELNCFYGIANLVGRIGISLDGILQGIVELIPPAWQYPEITSVRICIGDQQFKTQNFKDTIWKQASDITIHNKKVGTLEICYLEEKPQNDEGPFLAEERKLINAIAERLGRILERKHVQEVLEVSEKKFKDLVEITTDWVWEVDKDGLYTYASPKVRDLLGYEPWEVVGRTPFELMPEKEAEKIGKFFKEKAADKQPFYGLENINRHKNGHLVVLETSGIPLFDEKGQLKGYRGIDRDITEHKRVEKVLQVERDKLNDILDSIQDGVYIVNQENDIQYINPVLQKEFGPVKGNKCYEYFHDRKEVCPWCKNQEVFAGKTVRWEWYSFKNQKTYDLIDTPLRNSDGSISKLEIFRDITERKLAEEALRESEKKYHQLVDIMNEGLSVSDENYIFTFVNRCFAEILGYPPDKIIGRHITDFFDAKNKKIMRIQMALRRRGEEKSYDITWTGKDNRKIDTIISPRAFFDEKGNYKGSLGILTNITERKRFERQILKLNKELEKIVAKRTAKLRKAHKLLLEDIKKRKRLEKEIIEISEREKRRIGQELHDSVGQQFMGVTFMAKVLQQRITDKLPEEAATVAEIIRYVNEAAEQTKDLAKILHPVDLSTGGLITALGELAETTEKLFRVTCTFQYNELIEIEDTETAAHLYRIAQEAITNALKHGKTKKISISLNRNTDKSTLTVKNDGLNFPKQSEARGTGLGLQIMEHRSDLIHGTLSVHKADEGGTIVTCEFPLKKQR
jgi:PAS domain S-box-containing protein